MEPGGLSGESECLKGCREIEGSQGQWLYSQGQWPWKGHGDLSMGCMVERVRQAGGRGFVNYIAIGQWASEWIMSLEGGEGLGECILLP